jgi:OOP family OmpA-OmpF porin
MLRSFALFLKNNKTINVTITGHTDNVGDSSENLILSQKRAEEIKKYLISQKVSSSQIETEGKGSSKPITNNDSSQGREQNRRVEVKIIK